MMKLNRLTVTNFQGISSTIALDINSLTVLIGKNDVGKSTILKALDLFFNDGSPTFEMLNLSSLHQTIEICCAFDPDGIEIGIDEDHQTSFEAEEMLCDEGLVHVKKIWSLTERRTSVDVFIGAQTYEGTENLILLNQQNLIAKCRERNIQTTSAHNTEFNNAEKRAKLRDAYRTDGCQKVFDLLQLSTTGSGRGKKIYDGIKAALPQFEYFRADSSLSESETKTQNYFRSVVNQALADCLKEQEEIQKHLSESLNPILEDLIIKMNRSLPEEARVEHDIQYDWSKLVKVAFRTKTDDGDVPLSQRGDGFRRITMMSLFEHLAEKERRGYRGIIFGFEEPETFLHPSAQEKLFESLNSLAEVGYRVVICTHSPIIVACSPIKSLVHVSRQNAQYRIDAVTSYEAVAEDLGISIKNQFITTFDTSKVLLLVEGPDDVKAMRHICKLYKKNKKVPHDFEEIGIQLFPIGGKDSIKHLITLSVLKQLRKPFIVWLDSDQESAAVPSSNRQMLIDLHLIEDQDFAVTAKRSMENYISPAALNRLFEGAAVMYGDFDCVKTYCKDHPMVDKFGGRRVLDHHFEKLTFKELQDSLKHPSKKDEFIFVYEMLKNKIPQTA